MGGSLGDPAFFVCAALNIAFSVESCHMRASWCTESNVCICLDNAEKKSGSTLFKDERKFYTFQFHTTLLCYTHNNNIDYVMICNFQISIIMAVIFRYWLLFSHVQSDQAFLVLSSVTPADTRQNKFHYYIKTTS